LPEKHLIYLPIKTVSPRVALSKEGVVPLLVVVCASNILARQPPAVHDTIVNADPSSAELQPVVFERIANAKPIAGGVFTVPPFCDPGFWPSCVRAVLFSQPAPVAVA
jgi:hypothetical protein